MLIIPIVLNYKKIQMTIWLIHPMVNGHLMGVINMNYNQMDEL